MSNQALDNSYESYITLLGLDEKHDGVATCWECHVFQFAESAPRMQDYPLLAPRKDFVMPQLSLTGLPWKNRLYWWKRKIFGAPVYPEDESARLILEKICGQNLPSRKLRKDLGIETLFPDDMRLEFEGAIRDK